MAEINEKEYLKRPFDKPGFVPIFKDEQGHSQRGRKMDFQDLIEKLRDMNPNRARGAYYRLRGRAQGFEKQVKRKVRASRNALKSVWRPEPQAQVKTISDAARIERFFIFCKELEDHQFLQAHGKGGQFQLSGKFDTTSVDEAKLNFDDLHLETVLTRIRQVIFENELFFLDNLTQSVREVFPSTPNFEKRVALFQADLDKPYPATNEKAFLKNGQEAIAGKTFAELLKQELYTGRIHSQDTVDPSSENFGIAEEHPFVRQRITLELAGSSLRVIQYIFELRRQIREVALAAGREDEIASVREFGERCRAAGV